MVRTLPIRCHKLTEFVWNPHKYWGYFRKILFKFYRSRRFAGQIVEYSVYAFHFVDDPAHDFLQHFKWNLCAFGCHEIDGLYSAERYGVVVGTLVAHDTDERMLVRAAKY